MKSSKSSKRWLQAHFADPYVQQAQHEGYRSRAVYKLKEIDEKDKLLKPGMNIVDLGAAPGGWSQYAAQKLKNQARILATDILPMDPLEFVTFIQGDFREDAVFEALMGALNGRAVDLVMSDMAPNMSGTKAIDAPAQMYLLELAFDFACKSLREGGDLLVKIFHGPGFDEYVKNCRANFAKVIIRKPKASRPGSRETYLLARGYNV